MTHLRTPLGKSVDRSLTAAFSLKTTLTTTANKIPAGRVYPKEGLNVPHDVPLGLGQAGSDIVPVCLQAPCLTSKRGKLVGSVL